MNDLLVWLFSFFVLIALIVIVIYQLMSLADLEFDYINPYDSASRINKVILPEYITHGALSLFFLVTGHWFMCLLCLPYLYYNVKSLVLPRRLFLLAPLMVLPQVLVKAGLALLGGYMDRQHLVDVTEIFNMLNAEKKKRLFKLGYLVIVLFFSLFWMIWSALEDDEHV